MDHGRFAASYRDGRPPWDIDGPQPALAAAAAAGEVAGDVLDAGCGTGENALHLAGLGHAVTGVDYVEEAIERARARAIERGLAARAEFVVGSALELERLGRTFDTAIDSGLFHTFDDGQRALYVASLTRAVRRGGRLLLLCFSDREPAGVGPRRITRPEIEAAFRDGWEVVSIEPIRFRVVDGPEAGRFSEGGPWAWFVKARREPGP